MNTLLIVTGLFAAVWTVIACMSKKHRNDALKVLVGGCTITVAMLLVKLFTFVGLHILK